DRREAPARPNDEREPRREGKRERRDRLSCARDHKRNPSDVSATTTSHAGRPTTFVYEPSMRDTIAEPRPCTAYPPALSNPSPLAAYAHACSADRGRNVTWVVTVSSWRSAPEIGAITKCVFTSCVRPARRSAIRWASPTSAGLPRISPPRTTVVSAT